MKFHPRIHPVNYSLLRTLPANHPAVRALQVHAEARDVCVGKEIDWPDQQIIGIDQVWWSDLDLKEKRFSNFAYENISYDLFLDGWVESAPEATEAELGYLEDIPKIRLLIEECEAAAKAEENEILLPVISKAAEFIDSLEEAILFRFKCFGIQHPALETDCQ